MENNEAKDIVCICVYCGELIESPNAKQIKIFGFPECCEEKMLLIDRNKLFKIVKGLENLKAKMESEILRGMI